MSLCSEFIDIYRATFLKPDQQEDPSIWLSLMDAADASHQLHIIVAQEGPVLGGLVFEDFGGTGCWLASYLVVHPDARRRGIAEGLIQAAVRDIDRISLSRNDDGWVLFAEAENPSRLIDQERCVAEQRLRVLARLALKPLPFAYVQPALALGKNCLDDLMLLCYAPQYGTCQMATARITLFLAALYRTSGQPNSVHLQRMCALLNDREMLTFGDTELVIN